MLYIRFGQIIIYPLTFKVNLHVAKVVNIHKFCEKVIENINTYCLYI